MSTSQTLDHISLSPQPPNPPLKVLLVLTPNPARLSELKALEAFAQQFCEDFSSSSFEEYSQEEWCCINLYAHFRECVAMRETGDASDDSELGDADGVKRHCENNEDLEVGIGFIHPYALLEKLDQEKEVQWRLAIPVLRGLIDREVEKGARAFVVSGLRVGDVEGVRAFGKSVSNKQTFCTRFCLATGWARWSPMMTRTDHRKCLGKAATKLTTELTDRQTRRHTRFPTTSTSPYCGR